MDTSSDMRHQASWEDEIDLRELVEALLRHKWIILGLIVVAVTAAGVYSAFIMTPRYEATMTVALPAADGREGLGMGVNAYNSFAGSNRVLATMVADGGLDWTPSGAGSRLRRSVNAGERLLTVTASASTPGEAHRLLLLWRDAFEKETRAYVEEQLSEALTAARLELAVAERELDEAEQALSNFDRDTPVIVQLARLSRLAEDLAAAESGVHELLSFTIPLDTVRIRFLEEALSYESDSLAVAPIDIVSVATPGAHGAASVLHPVYELAAARARLETNRRAAELLQERADALRNQLAALNDDTVVLQAERRRLQQNLDMITPSVREARARVTQLENIWRQLAQLTHVRVVVDPVLPETPAAPRTTLNMALAGFLALFVGVGFSLFHEFWRKSA